MGAGVMDSKLLSKVILNCTPFAIQYVILSNKWGAVRLTGCWREKLCAFYCPLDGWRFKATTSGDLCHWLLLLDLFHFPRGPSLR